MATDRGFFPLLALIVIGTMACSPPLAATPTPAPAKPSEKPAAAKPATEAAPAQAPAQSTAPNDAPAAAPKDAPKEAAKPAGADPLAAATASFYDAAKAEGKLVIYGGGQAALFEPVQQAFNKRYPGIAVENVDQRGRESREKVFAEQRGKNFVADIVTSGFSTQTEILEAGFVEVYQSASIPDVIPELMTNPGYFNPRTVSIFSVSINTSLVPPSEEPKTWDDVMNPKWRGKIGLDDPRGSGPGGTIVAGLELSYGLEYSKKLADQKPFMATQAGPIWAGLQRGEYAMFISSSSSEAVKYREQGAPIKFLKLQDGVGITQSSMSIIKNAPHPNAAKLWIEWTLSEEGQLILAAQGYAPVRVDVKPAEPEAMLEGFKIFPRDDTPEAFAQLGDRTKRWEELFFK